MPSPSMKKISSDKIVIEDEHGNRSEIIRAVVDTSTVHVGSDKKLPITIGNSIIHLRPDDTEVKLVIEDYDVHKFRSELNYVISVRKEPSSLPKRITKKLDGYTLERVAEFICGDDSGFSPVYRTGSELTRFFHRVGLTRFTHDGSTRKWWTLNVLESCSPEEQRAILLRLASPKEYAGNPKQVRNAIDGLNQILNLEGLRAELHGVTPALTKAQPRIDLPPEGEYLQPLPPPDFDRLELEPGVAEALKFRWEEADRCVNAEAYLAAIIMMGSLLEGLLLAVIQRKPKEANRSRSCPKNPKTGKPKPLHEWSLSQMIDVAHNERWIDLDVSKFSHSLREFRNLVHPYQQMALKVYPDSDTCTICWHVVQAAVNDLASSLNLESGQ